MILLPVAGLCISNGPGFNCSNPTAQSIADLALSIVLLSVFTGVPLLLAGMGAVLCVLDIGAWLKNRH